MTNKLIRQLVSIRGLKIECPHCDEQVPIGKAKPFSMYDSYPPHVQQIIRTRFEDVAEQQDAIKEGRRTLAEHRKKKPERIRVSAQASHFGEISEQILPAFLTFPYKHNECRILFKPIDYLVFGNLSINGCVDHIKFVEVKTGNGQLDNRQRQIRDRVVQGKFRHKVIG
ncbi:MAG: hypothetical protein LAP21_09475 [Acidobacteriia bacterium]|nr:hypothetical protein [Terriglobia bacterium]